MKKVLTILFALSAVGFASTETRINAGYDFARELRGNEVVNKSWMKNGISAGAEQLFQNDKTISFGAGAEYKSAHHSRSMTTRTGSNKLYKTTNVYGIGKYNVVKKDDGSNPLYVVGRLGYGFAGTSKALKDEGINADGGLYWGAGVGTEIGKVNAEVIYESNNLKFKTETGKKDRSNQGSVGVRVGYTIGKAQKAKRYDYTPMVKPAEPVVEEKVEEPVEIPAPSEFGVLPFSCDLDNAVCTIRGFNVDGKTPVKDEEITSIRKITETINKFAEGGSIELVGHTDSTGSEKYNLKLSQERAENLAKLLRANGLSDKITIDRVLWYGEEFPIDTNATETGRYNNRRVDLFFKNVDFENVRLTNGN